MVTNKRKKFSRYRASHTHGKGSKKKRRGSGNRGGYGMAGTGKRSDHNKPSIWATDYFGKHGFVPQQRVEKKTVNILDLELKESLSRKEKDSYVADLTSLGYDKLLGKGRATKRFIITVEHASARAVEKIKAAGGEIKLTSKEPKAPHFSAGMKAL